MFSSKKSTPAANDGKSAVKRSGSNVPTLIAKDTHIIGNLASDGIMDIDGRIEGNVHCAVATIRRNGHIKGDLIADSVFIHGQVQGLIRARSVNFYNGCRVEGVIHHEAITIEDGAFVDGRFKRSDNIAQPTEGTPSATVEKLHHPFGDINSNTPFFDDEAVQDGETAPIPAEADKRDVKQQSRMLDKLKLIGDVN